MTNDEFVSKCKRMVCNYTNEHLEKSCSRIIVPNNVYIVWMCKTLQNNKALLSTVIHDGRYYEVTYNGDEDEFYFDSYKQETNYCIDSTTLQVKDAHDGTFDSKK